MLITGNKFRIKIDIIRLCKKFRYIQKIQLDERILRLRNITIFIFFFLKNQQKETTKQSYASCI